MAIEPPLPLIYVFSKLIAAPVLSKPNSVKPCNSGNYNTRIDPNTIDHSGKLLPIFLNKIAVDTA